MNQMQYNGAIIGAIHRIFFTIPTRHPKMRKYTNVHYLLDTGSSITTLTHRALCAIHEKQYSDHLVFTNENYKVGNQ